MFALFKKKHEPERIDRRGIARGAIALAIKDATNDYQSKDWPLYAGIGDDLESFLQQVRCHVVNNRPL